jgi:hypothetical protein
MEDVQAKKTVQICPGRLHAGLCICDDDHNMTSTSETKSVTTRLRKNV